MRSLLTLLLAGLLACRAHALEAAAAKPAEAKPKPQPIEKAPNPGRPASLKAASSKRTYPFHGKVTAVDPAGKSFSLKGALKDRVFLVTETTKIFGRDSAPVDVFSLAPGEEVTGSAKKSEDSVSAVTVYIGGKNAAARAQKKAEKAAAAAPATGGPSEANQPR